jgi:DNA-binding MarR family transcriptional regulator
VVVRRLAHDATLRPANMGVMAPAVPLSTLLSQALVAHTVELDNEAEHRLPHRTTMQGVVDHGRGEGTRDDSAGGGGDGTPWLVSYALWANVLQYLDDAPVRVGELRARARTDQLLLGGLRRWGYVTVNAPEDQPLQNPPQDDAVVRTRRAARRAHEVWQQLPAVIDGRWRERLGPGAVDRLERALRVVFDKLDIDPPAYLPVIHPTQGGATGQYVSRRATPAPLPPSGVLSPLLSGVLMAWTVAYEAQARISLPISATTLRVVSRSGTRVRDLPRLTGVSPEANAMCAGWLERQGCVTAGSAPAGGTGKVLRLTSKGQRAQEKHRRVSDACEESWRTTFGDGAIDALRSALGDIVGDGPLAASPLAPGLAPHSDNWRARVRRPEILPHHPMVLHRGGYPDGS